MTHDDRHPAVRAALEALAFALTEAASTDDAAAGHAAAVAAQHAATALASELNEAHVPGLPQLVRLVAAGLAQRAASSATIAVDDAAALVAWLALLEQRLDDAAMDGTVLLVELERVTWIPDVAGRMREYLLAHLAPAATVAQDEPATASGVADTPDAVAETAAEENAFALADETPAAGAITPIWISPLEFQLTSDTLAERALPLIEALAADPDSAQSRELWSDYVFQIGLVGNAFEVLGLPACQHATGELVRRLDTALAGAAVDPAWLGALMSWQVALLGFVRFPDDSTTIELWLDAWRDGTWPEQFGPDIVEPVAAELARVAIGNDPSLESTRKRTAEPGDVQLAVAPDVLPSVLDGMLRELPGNAAALGTAIDRYVRDNDTEALDRARRVAHTLKGDANTVGVRGIANITHALEDVLVELARQKDPPPRELADALLGAADCVAAMADHVLGRGAAPDDAQDALQGMLNWANALVEGGDVGAAGAATGIATSVAPTKSDVGATPKETAEPQAVPTLQIPVPLLDELLRLSTETIVLARQIEDRLLVVSQTHADIVRANRDGSDLVAQLDDLVALRGAALQSVRLARDSAVDPLELDQYNELHTVSRRLLESGADQRSLLGSIDGALNSLRELTAAQDRVQLDLQQGVLRTRTLPFGHVVPRFARVVRQTARTLMKDVALHVEGETVAIDSDILDRLVEPLVHALRNAVDHGIEPPQERLNAGKSSEGVVRLGVRRDGNSIVVTLKDDGRGLDYAAIRRRAQARGMLDPLASDDELAKLILLPGFSTREETTHVSGRGIGMDVVARRVHELRGTMDVRSTPGQGVQLTIVLPASVISAHVALARHADGVGALVTASIGQFVPVPAAAVVVEDGRLLVDVGTQRIPATTLDAIMAPGTAPVPPRGSCVGAVVDVEAGRVEIVLLESVGEMREVIVKGLGRYVATVNGVRGVTILGDGGIAPVLDLAAILRAPREAVLLSTGVDTRPQLPSVVIADDSLTVRRALGQLLEDAGFQVRVARDGLEALDLIQDEVPDAVLLDLEMPRMNGLELTSFLRTSERTRGTPVIMITSRTSDRHRQLANAAGVDDVLGKPYSDEEVLALVNGHVHGTRATLAMTG